MSSWAKAVDLAESVDLMLSLRRWIALRPFCG